MCIIRRFDGITITGGVMNVAELKAALANAPDGMEVELADGEPVAVAEIITDGLGTSFVISDDPDEFYEDEEEPTPILTVALSATTVL
jgi:hypothetical protein